MLSPDPDLTGRPKENRSDAGHPIAAEAESGMVRLAGRLRESQRRAAAQVDKTERVKATREKIKRVKLKAIADFEHFREQVDDAIVAAEDDASKQCCVSGTEPLSPLCVCVCVRACVSLSLSLSLSLCLSLHGHP